MKHYSLYKGSELFKDACEVGQKEYASSYRTLLMFVELKQKNINLYELLGRAEGFSSFVLWGGGPISSLLCNEIPHSVIGGIIENNKVKYIDNFEDIPMYGENEIPEGFFNNKKVIVTDMYRMNQITERLNDRGVTIDDIVSAEEVMAYALYMGEQ